MLLARIPVSLKPHSEEIVMSNWILQLPSPLAETGKSFLLPTAFTGFILSISSIPSVSFRFLLSQSFEKTDILLDQQNSFSVRIKFISFFPPVDQD